MAPVVCDGGYRSGSRVWRWVKKGWGQWVILPGLGHYSWVPSSPIYTIQPVVKPVWQRDVSCIQIFNRGFDNRLYRVYSWLSNRLYRCTTRFDKRLNEQLFVQHGCQTVFVKPVVQPVWQPVGCLFTRYSRLSNQLYNRFDNQRPVWQTGLTTGCIV